MSTPALSTDAGTSALADAMAAHAHYAAVRAEALTRRAAADHAIYQAWRECRNVRTLAAALGTRPATIRRALARVAPPADVDQLDIYTILDNEADEQEDEQL